MYVNGYLDFRGEKLCQIQTIQKDLMHLIKHILIIPHVVVVVVKALVVVINLVMVYAVVLVVTVRVLKT
jgi:hypothetical protein